MKVTGTDGKEYTIEPEASLRDAYLSGADLTDVCLSEADLSKVNLRRAIWNDETVFPEGFEIPDELRG